MRALFLFAIATILIFHPCEGGVLIKGRQADLRNLDRKWMTPITLEHATTTKQLQWGMMQRDSLPRNHGMTFNFPQDQTLSFWMFNCLIDLSVAYLDEQKVIREIHELKAHPNVMDPERPVKKLRDLTRYPPDDPILALFRQESATSEAPVQYAMEMNINWFIESGVKAGDVATWHTQANIGFIIHTLDISEFVATEKLPYILILTGQHPLAVWAPNSIEDRDIAFLDKDLKILQRKTLQGGGGLKTYEKEVLSSGIPIKYCIIATPGWLSRNLLEGGVTVDGELLLKVEPQIKKVAER